MPIVDQCIMCTSCGTNLRAEDVLGVCSACGKSIEETLRLVGVDPVLMNVAEDVVCLRCGYNLRTIPIGAVCPECGDAVVTSLRVDDLRNADRQWLRRIRSGVTFLLLTPVITIGISVLFGMLGFAVGAQAASSGFISVANTVSYLALWVVGSIGIFKATASDPSPAGREYSNVYRNTARICTFVPLVLMVVFFAAAWQINVVPGTIPANFASVMKMTIYSGAIMIVSFGLCSMCLVICLRRLFHRARQIGLRRLATVHICFVGAGMILGTVAIIIFAYVMIPLMTSPAVTAAMSTTAPSTPLPGAVVGNPSPGVTVEDYTSDEQNSVSTPRTGMTTSSAPVNTSGVPTAGPAPAVMPVFPTASVIAIMGIVNCGGGVVFLTSAILGLIVLFKSRGLLTKLVTAS